MTSEAESLIDLMLDNLEQSNSPVVTLEIIKTKSQVQYMVNRFEGMRKSSALESILYDHADDPTYGWGSLAWLMPEINKRPGGYVFTIRRYAEPQPNPNLLICRAIVSEKPVPYVDTEGIPYNPARFIVIKRRLLQRTKRHPSSEETLNSLIRGVSLAMDNDTPILISTYHKIISNNA